MNCLTSQDLEYLFFFKAVMNLIQNQPNDLDKLIKGGHETTMLQI